ncbi:MAG TPA: hypothetical protein DCS63_02485 [Elusimicrobia bacterium]|nr:hypothetical protein [Elusimicrobiota bacterium]
MGGIVLLVSLPAAFAAEPQGRIIRADIRPAVIYAGSRFNIHMSGQNTGSSAWQSYGLRVRLYNSRRKLVKFPAGIDFTYSVTAPWPAGLVYSIDTAIAVPGLNEFMGSDLASGIYYYLPELYASATASAPAALFKKSPVDRGTLTEIRIYNPSVYRRNAAVAAVRLSSAAPAGSPAAVKVRLKNFDNSNMSGLTLKLFSNEALVGEKAVALLAAQQETEVEFGGIIFDDAQKTLKLKAVLVAEDDSPEDNYLSVELPFGRLSPP